MEITYGGNSTFLIRGERQVAIDPVRGTPADVRLYSNRQRSSKQVVNGPGEYELRGVMVATAQVNRRAAACLAHVVTFEGVSIAFLPAGTERLDNRTLEAFGHVDVLLLPAGDIERAQALRAQLRPSTVIPYGPGAAEVCSALGAPGITAESRLAWNAATPAPGVRLLKARRNKPRAA